MKAVHTRVRGISIIGLLAVLLLATSGVAGAQTEGESDRIPAEEAAAHVGEEVTVCGLVVETSHVSTMEGAPTFLNFGSAYPDQVFGVVIYEENVERFRRRPDRLYREQEICVTGTIELSDGKPRMVVTTPEAIEVVASDS